MKIFKTIGVCFCVVALVGFCFNLPEYDFFVQLELISQIDFINPLECFIELVEKTKNLSNWGELNIAWYEYIPKFFDYLGTILQLPISIVKNLALDIIYFLEALMLLLGFRI